MPRRPDDRAEVIGSGFLTIIRIGIALDALILAVAIGLTVTQSVVVLLGAGPPGARAVHLLPVIAVGTLVAMSWAGVRSRAVALLRHAPVPIGGALDRPRASRHLLELGATCLLPPLLWLATRAAGTPAAPARVFVAAGGAAGLLLLARAATALRGTEWIIEHDMPTQVLSLAGMSRVVRDRARRPGHEPLSLCLVALDDFKAVNDTLGGAGGNAVLTMVARRLTTALGDRGTVGRLGGDRFLALLPDHPEAGREALDVFAEPFVVDNRRIRLTASVGVAPLAAESGVDVLLGMADLAMQVAKATVVMYRPELQERLHAPRRMLQELRDLLDGAPVERVGRLVVVYQPIVELPSSRIVGCEALVRWQHPERHLLLPDVFLPAVEQGGLTPRLDGLVLDLALGGLAHWDAEGLEPITLSVNLGLGSMTDPDLFPRVRTLLETHEVASDRVRLEITEHSELPDDDVVTGSLRSLTDLGVRLSLDDFGAGYTSLNYLCRYPVDLVKIDRSIVVAEGDQDASPLLEGIVGLAAALHVGVLAEGIETEAQRQRLARIGVGHGQGYLFARPLEAGVLADVLRRPRAACPPPQRPPGTGRCANQGR